MKKNGFLKTASAVMVLFALLLVDFSPVLCNDTHHDCTGEECFICLAVSSIRENYEHLTVWNQVLSFAFVLFLSLTATLVVPDVDGSTVTPIKLKVKLSN